jgi:hypothetical protein
MTMKKMLKRLVKTEKGQALPMVLILMVIAGLILAPTLTYTTSGLKVGQAYERMADEFYAADAGVEDGLWQIKYDHLEDLFGNYERYLYNHEYGPYSVSVNGIDVEIKIENVWVADIAEPSLDEAKWLAGTDKLLVAGCVSAEEEETQQVKIHYTKEAGDPELLIEEIGVWLPPGYSYDEEGDGSLALEDALAAAELSYSRDSYPHKGGEVVVWTFDEPAPFTALPGVNEMDNPMTCTFTFNFERDNPESRRNPEAVSWIKTSPFGDFTYTWDADVMVFHINSVASGEEGTTIDAYAIKSDPRQLISGINGDYRAIGNTLMVDNYPDWGGPRLDTLLDYSDTTVNDIPQNAHVDHAFLYWSGWLVENEEEETVFIDTGEDIYTYWNPGSDWSDYSWHGTRAYQAHHSSGSGTELVMKNPLELSIYESGMVTLSFDYWIGGRLESGDCLQYAFYNGSVWSGWYPVFCDDQGSGGASTTPRTKEITVPDPYLTANFKMKFRITGFDGGGSGGTEYCYIDNIEITAKIKVETIADTGVKFWIDGEQVYLEYDEYGRLSVPTKGDQDLLAKKWQVLENKPNEYSYSCMADVTPLLQWDEVTDGHGNATYRVGGVDADTDNEWSYAAWSLVIIYSSPETKRHQLYRYDDFTYVDNDEYFEYPISGFLVPDPIRDPDTGEIIEETAATITCFVGEGDDYYPNDYISLNPPPTFPDYVPDSYKLWDGTLSTEHPGSNTSSSPNNVWNSKSIGLERTGIDIDTFHVSWESGLLEPGDTSALVALKTATDSWNLIYIIIAFRSETVTGGTVTYLIEG